MSNILSKVTRKDLVYTIIILVIINMFSLVLFFSTDEDLVSYFGFAGTITGIILAVVALIYTFYQNITLGNASIKLEEFARTATEFSGHLGKLDKLDKLDNIPYEIGISIDRLNESTHESIKAINSAVEQLEISVTYELRNQGDELRRQREHMEQRFDNSQIPDSHISLNQKIFDDHNDLTYSEQSLNFLIDSLPPFILVAIYVFIKGKEANKSINSYSYLRWSYENSLVIFHIDHLEDNASTDDPNPRDHNIVILKGFVHYFGSNSWVDIIGTFAEGEISEINDSFKRLILLKIKSYEYILLEENLHLFFNK